MNKPSKWLTLILFLTAAIGSYWIGFSLGIVLLVFLGAAFELGFWVKLLKRKKEQSHP